MVHDAVAGFAFIKKCAEFFKNLFDSSGATLTVALYNYAKERADFDSAFAVAVVLLVIAFAINIAAKLAGKKLKKR